MHGLRALRRPREVQGAIAGAVPGFARAAAAAKTNWCPRARGSLFLQRNYLRSNAKRRMRWGPGYARAARAAAQEVARPRRGRAFGRRLLVTRAHPTAQPLIDTQSPLSTLVQAPAPRNKHLPCAAALSRVSPPTPHRHARRLAPPATGVALAWSNYHLSEWRQPVAQQQRPCLVRARCWGAKRGRLANNARGLVFRVLSRPSGAQGATLAQTAHFGSLDTT